MPVLGRAGRARAGTCYSALTLLLVIAALVVPTMAAAAPVGSDAVHSQLDSNSAGSAEAFTAVASASASVDRLHVYLEPSSTASEVELGLYSGSSEPATKLAGCSVSSPNGGWNSCALASAVQVTKGTTYWTALLQPRSASGVLRFRDTVSRSGDVSYSSSSSSLSSLPDSYQAGDKWPSAFASMYADSSAGDTGTDVPPVRPVDSDGDGVPDSSDQCPTEAGPASNNGCPAPPADGDGGGDGVPDSSDQCPTEAGPASNHGCPAPPPTSTGKNCMPNPSACGYPDMTNTGTLPGVARQAVSGTVTLSTPGQVYENKTVTGSIVVTASNVTIRNVKVISRAYWAISSRKQNGNPSGLRIEDTEIDLQGNEDAYGIIEDNYTAVRTLIHNGSDCTHLGTNVTIKDSFCSVGPDTNNDGWADSTGFCSGPEHFDGYSSDGGANQVMDHNTIRNPCSQTSAILMSTNSGPISTVTITNNLLAGGGYTLYCAATAGGIGGIEVVTGNRIAKTYRPQGGYYGPVAYCSTADTFIGNVWDDTGVSIGR